MTPTPPPSYAPPPDRGESEPDRRTNPGGAPLEASGGEVPVDSRIRKDRRSGKERRQRDEPVANDRRKGRDRREGTDRRRSGRKRSINEYGMPDEVREFAEAVARFRRENDNRFPTAAQLLKVLYDLGYRKTERG